MPQRYNYSSILFAVSHWLLYAVLFWTFAPNFRYAFGPDFVSYTAIAEKYAAGDFAGAVNSWWSPAYSWLLAVGSFCTKDMLLANKIIQFLAGFPALLLLRNIIFLHTPVKKDIYAEWLLLAFVPALVWWALTADTPDFYSAVALLWFFYRVLRLSEEYSFAMACYTGVAGAIAYWLKSYNFWFVVFFGLAVLIYQLFKRKSFSATIKQWTIVALFFLGCSLVWILVLQTRFQQFTVSAIGWHQPCENNYVLQQKPVAAAADCAPLQFAATNRYSNWETPGVYPVTGINNYLQENNITKILEQNSKHFFSSFVSRYQLIVLVILVLFSLAVWRKYLFYYAAFWGIYCAGYWLFHLEARFFILPSILLMLGITVSFLRVAETITGRWLHVTGILALLVLFTHSYLFNLWKFDRKTVPEQVHGFIQKQAANGPQKNIAAAAGLYDEGLYYAFFTGNRFFGSLTMPEKSEEAVNELSRNNIDYLLRQPEQGVFLLLNCKQDK